MVKFIYYKGILSAQFSVPKISTKHKSRIGSVVLEPRFILKNPVEISEVEFRSVINNRQSEGSTAFQKRFASPIENKTFTIEPHIYQKGKVLVEFEFESNEYADIVDEIFVQYTPVEADEAYKNWEFIAQKDHVFHGRITGEGYCRLPHLSSQQREKEFADLIEKDRIAGLKNNRGCLYWFLPNRNYLSILTGSKSLNAGCGSMGCGLLALLLLLGLLFSLWKGCTSSEIQPQNSPRVIHDTVYLKEKRQVKEFIDSTTIKKTDVILLPNVQFYSNSANLLPYSIQSIQELADYMVAHPNLNAVIKGHTDDVGDADANLKLSQARAETVRQVLMSFGIDASRIQAKGYGEQMPKTRDQTVEARAINRRVEVELTNTEETETIRTEKPSQDGN